MEVPVVITGPVAGLSPGQQPGVPQDALDESVGPVVLWTPIPLAQVLAPSAQAAAATLPTGDGGGR